MLDYPATKEMYKRLCAAEFAGLAGRRFPELMTEEERDACFSGLKNVRLQKNAYGSALDSWERKIIEEEVMKARMEIYQELQKKLDAVKEWMPAEQAEDMQRRLDSEKLHLGQAHLLRPPKVGEKITPERLKLWEQEALSVEAAERRLEEQAKAKGSWLSRTKQKMEGSERGIK